MPVSTQPERLDPRPRRAEGNIGSTAGLQKLIGGPSLSAITAVAVAARDRHVLAARRQIDRAGIDLLAIDRFVRRAMGRAGEMLGQDGR